MPNAKNIRVAGQGALWIAPGGTVVPADSTTAWGAGFNNLGFATNGFSLAQDLKTTPVGAWQTLEPVLLINSSLAKSVTFETIESNKQSLALAFGGATVVANGVAAGGAVTFGSGTITTATAHGFSVGQAIVFAGVTGSPGVVAGTPYYVLTVPTGTTITISASAGGSLVTITAGAATSVAPYGPFTLSIPDSPIAPEYVLGIDWQHGTASQRFVIPRFSLLSLPTLKYVRDDVVRFPLAAQVLKPLDNSQSMIPYGNDAAAQS